VKQDPIALTHAEAAQRSGKPARFGPERAVGIAPAFKDQGVVLGEPGFVFDNQ